MTIINGPFSEVPWLYSGFLPPSSGHTKETGNSLESAQGQKKITLHILQAFKTKKDDNAGSVEDTAEVIKKKKTRWLHLQSIFCFFLIKTCLE